MRLFSALQLLLAITLSFGQTPSPQEVPAPQPSDTFKPLIEQINRQLKSGRFTEALKSTRELAAQAIGAKDAAAEAIALRKEAETLEKLHRTPEARLLWQQTAAASGRANDLPGEAEALATYGLLLPSADLKGTALAIARAADLARQETNRPTAAARALLNPANRALGADRDALATQLVNLAGPILLKIPGSQEVAFAENILGMVVLDGPDPAGATKHFQAASVVGQKYHRSYDYSTSLRGRGQVEKRLGHYGEAKKFFSDALDAINAIDPRSPNAGICHGELGALADDAHHWAEAYSEDTIALGIVEANDPHSPGVAISLMNLGCLAIDEGDFVSARSYLVRADNAYTAAGDFGSNWAGNIFNFGLLADDEGDLAEAHSRYELATRKLLAVNPNSPDLCTIYLGAGNLAFQQGDIKGAEIDYRRALEIDRPINPTSAHTVEEEASLGHALATEGEKLEGLERLAVWSEAGRQLRAALRGAPASGKAIVAFYLGDLARGKQDYSAASGWFATAVDLGTYSSSTKASDLETYFGGLGEAAAARRHWDEAEKWFVKSKEMADSIKDEKGHVVEDANYADLLVDLGVVQLHLGHPEQALGLHLHASKIIDRQRSAIALPDQRRYSAEVLHEISVGLMNDYLALGDRVAAFTAVEASRGRGLSEYLFERSHLDLRAGAPPAVVAGLDALRRRRDALLAQSGDHLSRGGRPDTRLSELARVLDNILSDEEGLRFRSLKRLADLAYPAPPTFKQIQSLLEPDMVLLEYVVEDDQTTVFAVRRGSIPQVYRVAVTEARLKAEVERMFRSLREEADVPTETAKRLFSWLVLPAQKLISLPGSSTGRPTRLLVSPEKFLWNLPFSALRDRSGHYLVESCPVTEAVSMSVYRDEREHKKSSRRRLSVLAFGRPKYGGRPIAHAGADSVQLGDPPSDVPITGVQALGLASTYRGKARVGHNATLSALFRDGPKADIIHFGVHGKAERANPYAGYLMMAPEPRSNAPITQLTGYQVIDNLRINARLVTLADCETGAGQTTETEGVIGLARAFQYAGARSVLCTLCRIDADGTADLLSGLVSRGPKLPPSTEDWSKCFYGYLKSGSTKDRALQAAQKNMIARGGIFARPYYWAPFILIGDPN